MRARASRTRSSPAAMACGVRTSPSENASSRYGVALVWVRKPSDSRADTTAREIATSQAGPYSRRAGRPRTDQRRSTRTSTVTTTIRLTMLPTLAQTECATWTSPQNCGRGGCSARYRGICVAGASRYCTTTVTRSTRPVRRPVGSARTRWVRIVLLV